MKTPTQKENKEMAAQLRNPTGAGGIEIGIVMNQTNGLMIANTLKALDLKDSDAILELGHGNGKHIKTVLESAQDLSYQGLDISETMIAEAQSFCTENYLENQTNFKLYEGRAVPFPENSFDKIFTINTLYFWDEPTELLKELYRVLKPGGFCCVTFITERAMEGLEFTDYGFEKYNVEKFKKLVANTHFEILDLREYSETITGKLGDLSNRIYFVSKLTKAI